MLQGLKGVLFPGHPAATSRLDRERLTAIVTVADDGGSSGRLRRLYRIVAPGDIRSCLIALSEDRGALAELFRFRFAGEEDVGGHNLGNLILSALKEVEGDFPHAVERAGQILDVRGRVLPSTADEVTLLAELENGSTVVGESALRTCGGRVRRMRLHPETVKNLVLTITPVSVQPALATVTEQAPSRPTTSFEAWFEVEQPPTLPFEAVQGAPVCTDRASCILEDLDPVETAWRWQLLSGWRAGRFEDADSWRGSPRRPTSTNCA